MIPMVNRDATAEQVCVTNAINQLSDYSIQGYQLAFATSQYADQQHITDGL